MFRGKFSHTIDEKGRLQIPAKFREKLVQNGGETIIITVFDNCLAAYPMDEWVRIEAKLANLEQLNETVRAFQRFFIAEASECPIDKAGRVLLPLHLRNYAALQKDCIVAGQISKIEIWAQERWNQLVGNIADDFTDVASMMAKIGMSF